MKKILSIALFCLLAFPVMAETEEAINPAGRHTRPKVGVVLSGGGAKGIAHIGALKMLEELNIPVDYIVGTSIGSIIGGLYALGYNAADLDSLLSIQDWGKLIQDNVHRRDRLYEDKKLGDQLLLRIPFLTPRTFGAEASTMAHARQSFLDHIPSGFVEGHNLNQLFTAVSVGYQDSVDFNKLPIPFACVAIDLNTKKEYVFHGGNIVEAIRASMAIPGFFAPVRKDNMYLVDGGMANNFPVDVVREMGADIVIGVDLHAFDKAIVKPVENVGDLFGNLLNLMNGRKYNEGRGTVDILICPDTGSYGILDFNEEVLDALVDSGYVAADRQRAALEALSESQKAAGYDGSRFTGGRKAVNITQDSVYVSQITISGANPRDMSDLLNNSEIKVGTMVSGEEMENAIDEFYRTRAFSKVTYSMAGLGDEYNLKINFTPEKLHEFGLSFRFDTEEMAAIFLSVSINKHKLSGWKAYASGKLGQSPHISLVGSYAFSNKWQLNLSGSGSRIDTDLYAGDVKVFNANIGIMKAQFDLQNKGRNYELLLGARAIRSKYAAILVHPDYSAPLENGYKWNSIMGFVSFGFDNRDKSYFPGRGVSFNVDSNLHLRDGEKNGYKVERPYLDTYFDITGVIPIGKRFALIPQLYSRYIYSHDIIATQMVGVNGSTFGGYEKGRNISYHMPFVGENHLSFSGPITFINRLDVRYNLYKNHYITAIGNLLVSSGAFTGLLHGNHAVGVGLGYSIDTFLGPIGFNIHWSDINKKVGAYFTLGYSF